MTDYAIKAPDAQTFQDAMAALGLIQPNGDERTQGRMEDGTEWFFDYIGVVYNPVDWTPEGPNEPLVARPGVYANLRWNGAAEVPDASDYGVEIVWRSDSGQPLPDWWPRIIA